MKSKPVLNARRLRRVPRQFSWVDQRLVREGHLRGRTPGALALYLFLCVVGDGQGLSYYSEGRIGQLLSMSEAEVGRCRAELVSCGLVAYRRPYYQVLSLDPVEEELPLGCAPQERSEETLSVQELLRRVLEGGGR